MAIPRPARIGLLCGAALVASAPAWNVGAGSDATDDERVGRGEALFEQRWYVAPSGFGPWGRGPTSNAEACADCHAGYGRGAPPEVADEPMTAMVLRLSAGEPSGGGAPQPHPAYGLQLQTQGTLGVVPAEGSATIDWIETPVTLGDGTVIALRRPQIRMQALAFGELGPAAAVSARIPPPLSGLGRLESIPDAALETLAARDAGDGIRGKVNCLPDGTVGRFGHKATVASLREQTALALHEDLGLTSTTLPMQNCPSPQSACARQPHPSLPEVRDDQIDDLVALLRTLAAPRRQDSDEAPTRRGEMLFASLNCSGCHVPRISPGSPGAYTDLLLHDLGAGLADGRPEFAAGPRDWRTAPLWGAGTAAASGARFLHDGRARTLEEAILWHGGEAEAARQRYARLPRSDRTALIRFLSTL